MGNLEATLETGAAAVTVETPDIPAGTDTVAHPKAVGGSGPASDEPDVAARIDAARERAAQFVADRRFSEARQALEEADALESPTSVPEATYDTLRARGTRLLSAVRERLGRATQRTGAVGATETEGETEVPVEAEHLDPVEKSIAIVNLYSKIAAGVGILPGGLLNFGAILAVQVTMVWKIANAFGQNEGKDKIRGLILSLAGSALPTGVGAGVAYSVAAIPAATAGLVLGFVVTPLLAYALTRAVGNAFIMHFESGGTLLTFDPTAFREHILKDLETATALKD